MAEAIIAGLIRNQVLPAQKIIAAGPRPERGSELVERYGIRFTADNAEAVSAADIVILAVKPQKLRTVLAGLRGKIAPHAVVLSIIAGASIQSISSGLEHPAVIRAMPNTPAQIGQGITVWTSSPAVTEAQLEAARLILSAPGTGNLR
ncbi:MAG: hypothetical protein KatS3mg046_197 [Bellilinea sp.]|nr:MAG: hypothetical protein KatS3mg046_197 [Bellilinea sp.]